MPGHVERTLGVPLKTLAIHCRPQMRLKRLSERDLHKLYPPAEVTELWGLMDNWDECRLSRVIRGLTFNLFPNGITVYGNGLMDFGIVVWVVVCGMCIFAVMQVMVCIYLETWWENRWIVWMLHCVRFVLSFVLSECCPSTSLVHNSIVNNVCILILL